MASRNLLALSDNSTMELRAIVNAAIAIRRDLDSDTNLRFSYRGQTAVFLCWPQRHEGDPGALITDIDRFSIRSFQRAAESIAASCLEVIPHLGSTPNDVVETLFAHAGSDPRLLIIRHPNPGGPHRIAEILRTRVSQCAVINAGDGAHENPADAILYLTQILHSLKLDDWRNLTFLLLADFRNDPVARSLLFAIGRTDTPIILAAPPALLPAALPPEILHTTCFHVGALSRAPDAVIWLPIPDLIFEQISFRKQDYESRFSLSLLPKSTRSIQPVTMICRRSSPGPILEPPGDLGPLAHQGYCVIQPSVFDENVARLAVMHYCLSGLASEN